ncbi:MAG: hypothetical protein K0Q59_1550 [Paenibacillus sp.]|nr:hypothetical protein [Paenibacillus sp.]
MLQKKEAYAVVVCGGGLAGFCAAVAAARSGVRTCLIHDRPVFGGNSSSEVRVVPHGAARFHAYARETGIISELLIELLSQNHELMSDGGHNAVWDRILYDMAMETEELHVYLNTSVVGVNKNGERHIESIVARVSNAEVELTLCADIFVDCTGDGIVADLAGCEWMMGTESRSETLEPHAPPEASDGVMGSSIQFRAVDIGKPAPFKPPSWAFRYDDASFFYEKGRGLSRYKHGYWWLTIGLPWHTIHDNEQVRHQLTRHVLGVWDWIKNKDPVLKEKAAHMALDWVGQIPGKRESRRIKGMLTLSEHDVLAGNRFPDEIAFGGWYIDLHSPYGLLDQQKPEQLYETEDGIAKPSLVCGPYGLPLRMLIAKDADNLMMAGRNASVTHVALGTVRVMATTALMGQAAGTAAAFAVRQGVKAEELPFDGRSMKQIQQKLLRAGCFLPNAANEDADDLARSAKVRASSEACLRGVGPDSTGFVLDLKTHSREKKVDKNEPSPGIHDELLHRRGQWLALGTERIDRISVCLSNTSDVVQKVSAKLALAESIWDYRLCEEMDMLAETELRVEPGALQWVHWELGEAAAMPGAVGQYVRLDLLPNPHVRWHCAGAIEPGMMSAYDTGGRMRRYKYGQTLSFQLSPPQPCYAASNVLSGVTRPHRYTNMWRSAPNEALPQWIELEWDNRVAVGQVELAFAGHLFRELEHAGETPFYRDPQTAKDYRIYGWIQGEWTELVSVQDNVQRRRVHKLPQAIETSRLKIEIAATNGDPSAAIYEIRCYSGQERGSEGQ